jgi:hypothetical protein
MSTKGEYNDCQICSQELDIIASCSHSVIAAQCGSEYERGRGHSSLYLHLLLALLPTRTSPCNSHWRAIIEGRVKVENISVYTGAIRDEPPINAD